MNNINLLIDRDAVHHHHHGTVTQWKDLYFPKGCGGPGPGGRPGVGPGGKPDGSGSASGPGGVVGPGGPGSYPGYPGSAGTPGTPGTPGKLNFYHSSRDSGVLLIKDRSTVNLEHK